MGAKVSNQKNLLIPEQVEEVIEYEGYEEFPVIEVNRKAETKIDKIRPNPSLNNHSGGSSIGKYESENFVNKSKDKIDNNNVNNNQDENAKVKEESKFNKEKTDKKEEENNKNDNNENNENKDNNENNIILVNNNIEEKKEQEKVEEKGDILRGQNNNVNKVEINLEEKKPEENEQINNGGENIINEIKEVKEEEENNQDENKNYNNLNNGITEIKEEDINYNENEEKEKLNADDNNNINNDDKNEEKNDDFVEEKKVENDKLNNNAEIDDKGNQNDINNNNDKEINNLETKNEAQTNVNNNVNDDMAPKKIILPDISTIISEKVLQEGAGNELLFMSYLNEIVHISIKDRVIYSQKFCITSKDNFLIYENKDNYIQVKKPLAIIPISSIKNVVLFKLTKKVASYDHFYIEFDLDENNRNNINDKIDTFYENDLNNKTNENLKNTALVLFKTEEKNLAKEWYVLLKFLIDLNLKK